MTRLFSTGSRALLTVLGVIAMVPSGWCDLSLPLFDPFRSEAKVSPAPGVRWEPSQPLPAVTAPAATEQLSGDRLLTLPELTEFALRNNPKTRQAWLAARAA